MITLEAALADAAAQLDEVLQQRWDELALRLIGEGLNPVDVDDVLRQQQDCDLVWRAEVLASLRRGVIASIRGDRGCA